VLWVACCLLKHVSCACSRSVFSDWVLPCLDNHAHPHGISCLIIDHLIRQMRLLRVKWRLTSCHTSPHEAYPAVKSDKLNAGTGRMATGTSASVKDVMARTAQAHTWGRSSCRLVQANMISKRLMLHFQASGSRKNLRMSTSVRYAGQWPILHGLALLGIALFLHKVWCSKYSSQYLAWVCCQRLREECSCPWTTNIVVHHPPVLSAHSGLSASSADLTE